MASSTEPSDEVFAANPYDGHPGLSQTESEVLWEYAKLSQHLKALIAETRELSNAPDETLVPTLRTLETKVGLVLTLFKASVWGVINEQPAVSTSYEADSMDMTIQR